MLGKRNNNDSVVNSYHNFNFMMSVVQALLSVIPSKDRQQMLMIFISMFPNTTIRDAVLSKMGSKALTNVPPHIGPDPAKVSSLILHYHYVVLLTHCLQGYQEETYDIIIT